MLRILCVAKEEVEETPTTYLLERALDRAHSALTGEADWKQNYGQEEGKETKRNRT